MIIAWNALKYNGTEAQPRWCDFSSLFVVQRNIVLSGSAGGRLSCEAAGFVNIKLEQKFAELT